MADEIEFEIVTQVSAVYTATVSQVTLPGAEGELGILPGHRPLLTLVRPGSVAAQEVDGEERHFAVSEGYAEISDNKATLIVAECMGAEDIDIEAARSQYKEIEARVDEGDFATEEELIAESERLERARARVEAFENATGSR
jgi:F-type H+-transporting ATPase subunit epsilon